MPSADKNLPLAKVAYERERDGTYETQPEGRRSVSDADVGEDRILRKGIEATEQARGGGREGPPLTDDHKDPDGREKRWSVSPDHRDDFNNGRREPGK